MHPLNWQWVWAILLLGGRLVSSLIAMAILPQSNIECFTQLWTSTGFSPPKPHQKFREYIHNDDFIQNIKQIGSLPYKPGSFQIRIHWLLDLVKISSLTKNITFNFTELDYLVQLLHRNGLSIGFELMGNPDNYFTDFENPAQVQLWSELVQQIVSRYKGYNKLKKWNFESWNEPDHRDFDGLNFTEQGYLNYYDACEKGVHSEDPKALFGGPGASCRLTGFSKLCWSLVDHLVNGTNFFTRHSGTRLDFFSFHKKGGKRGLPGNSSYLLETELDTLQYLSFKFDERFTNLTLVNDEGDPVTGWDQPMNFRADVRYPAMVVKLVDRHLYSSNRLLQNYQMTSNDNAFLSFRPHYFTQRTLFARFQVNASGNPFSVLVRKPIFEVNAMLAQVRGKLLIPNVLENDYVGMIVSSSSNQLCYTFWISNDTSMYNGGDYVVKIHLPSKFKSAKYITRTLNNETQNTYEQWLKIGLPDDLTRKQIEILWNITMVKLTHPSYITTGTLEVRLRGPGVIQVMLCLDKKELLNKPRSLHFHNVTRHAVLITWTDEEVSDCFLTYQLEFMRTGEGRFQLLNREVLLSRSYQFTSALGVIGQYRVRSTNIIGQSGPFSDTSYYH